MSLIYFCISNGCDVIGSVVGCPSVCLSTSHVPVLADMSV